MSDVTVIVENVTTVELIEVGPTGPQGPVGPQGTPGIGAEDALLIDNNLSDVTTVVVYGLPVS